ncbi:11863_t:CDS:2 [Ambispora leptoticha]|uniref:11863_t:CDS:1 n=1 Tax=Ambispora leptoticha TaxID=144679 RepID=A0A9N9I2L5_9GLOM|nr:11863_t:CDS:2 [Ambispora leptoticha]
MATTSSDQSDQEQPQQRDSKEINIDNTDNYYVEQLHGSLNDEDLQKIVEYQINMQMNLEKSITTLNSLSELSAQKYDELLKKYEAHTKCVKEMKNDLEYIFRKIRLIKQKVVTKHSEAFAEVEKKFPKKDVDEENE